MGVVLVYLGARYLKTGDDLYRTAQRFWTRLFALNFAIGVASGIVMEFEFGTNWSGYSRFVGDVFGSALAAEGIFAFFLESGFLAVLVFGWRRVGPKMHFFSTLMVSLGSIFSSIWIVVANSWQQTPAGHHLVQMTRDGQPWFVNGRPVVRAEIVDFWALVFNPSTMHRLVHVLIGAFIMGSFFVMSISAWYLLKRRHEEFARYSFRGALILATIASLASLFSGHLQAKNVYDTQPAKMAAFEGHFHTGRGDLSLFGIPNEKEGRVDANIAIPGGLSFLLHEDFDAEVIGLDKIRPEDRPPVAVPFLSYHVMVALGVLFIALTLLAVFLLWRGSLFRTRWLMWVFVFAVIGPVVANQLGWAAAEVGRQPWIVHPVVERSAQGDVAYDDEGFVRYETYEAAMEDGSTETRVAALRTEDGVSPVLSGGSVFGSILMFGLIYVLLGIVWIRVLNDKIQHGPEGAGVEPPEGGGFLDAAGRLTGHQQSMTEAKEDA
jgi:cytochrome d ubiquinol oxidase subunit I